MTGSSPSSPDPPEGGGRASVETSAPPPLWLQAGRALPGMLRVGIPGPGYNMEKVSYGLAPEGVRFVKMSTLPLHRIFRPETRLTACPIVIGPRQDLIHTFNHLPRNGRFAVSFEAELPRFLHGPSEGDVRAGLEMLAGPRCRAILALSEAAAGIARQQSARFGLPEIEDRLTVFRGGLAVPAPLRMPNRDKGSGPVQALFVGTDAFRKGIEATLVACRALREAGVDLRLTVVGAPARRTYVAPLLHDAAALEAALAAAPWISHHRALPNRQVLDLMHRAHVLFLPTLDDSLGWAAIEAALCGAARAVSDVFAMPELVRDGEDGWTAPLPLRPDRRWRHLDTVEGAELWPQTQTALGEALARRILATGSAPGQLTELGEAARRRMAQLYDPKAAACRLLDIYRSAISISCA